jgi:SAM-dependent methyltransferase
MNCPLCGWNGSRIFAEWPDFTVQRCLDCGFRFVNTSAREYPQNAQFTYDEPEIGLLQPWLPHIQRRVRDILRLKQPPGRVLDIGCGKGEVTLALYEKGFDCSGIDMKPELVSQLKEQCPQVNWRYALTTDISRGVERYDILTMYHVLEHIPDPRAVLLSVKALANPGALIVIEVPNVGGWEARIKGRKWHYYKVDHVSYFCTADLLRLAKEFELEVLSVRGYQHFSYPQDVLWKDIVKGALGFIGFKDVVSVFLRAN